MLPISNPAAHQQTARLPLLSSPLFLSLLLSTMLGACSIMEIEPPDHPPNPAPDLRVLQEPNDTVRVGSTVRFTALFADSTKGYRVTWQLADRTSLTGRTVEWQVPTQPGTYYNGVQVLAGPNNGSTSVIFTTYVTQ